MYELSQYYQGLLEGLFAGDKRALARLMSLVEERPKEVYALMSRVCKRVVEREKPTPRLGITGPPGAGKSTLIDQLIRSFRKQGRSVGAVVIDPSSPFSGGAVLGDRVRMQEHSLDEGVFVRSLASRGSHGGISRATMEVALLLEAFGMEEIIIETVGVGQTELDIMGIADTTAVVLVPESGDTVQTLKAGILEIGNIFVINKADLEGADRLAIEIRSMLKMMPLPDEWDPRVIMCRARDGAGVDEFIDAVSEHRQHLEKFPDREKRLAGFRRQQLIEIILAEMRERLLASSAGIEARETGSSGLEESGGGLEDVFESVRTGEKDPYHAAAEILSDPERLAGILGFKK